jgi:hypothetical protein
MKRILFACAALLAASAPALAQYYPYPPRGGYYQEDPWGRPPPRPGWGGGGGGYYYERPVSIGNVCVTSRGNCRTRPRPEQSPCSCFIEGFGPKRGAVVSGW